MHSHGDLILELYAQARGKAAEYWGEDYLDSDRNMRRMGVPARAQEWLVAQSDEMKQYIQAFVDGMNAYADSNADKISDKAKAALPVLITDPLAHTQQAIHMTFIAGGTANAAERWEKQRGSNAWAIAPSRSASGNSLLLANPHLPWFGLFLFYEAQLTAPGVNVYGASLIGMPIPGIAFNDHLGWSHTVNTYDGADHFELALSGDGYLFDGAKKDFETEKQVIKIKQGNGGFQEEELTIRRSVHGPVVSEKDGKALAVRVAGLDQTDMFAQYWDMMRATNFDEFMAAQSRLQMPMFNTIYADRDGHIMMLHGGRVPKRANGDWSYWQGVVPGDKSETLWTETHAFDELPKVVDPPHGWVQNANDPPWTNTFPQLLDPEEFPAYMSPRGMSFRPQRSARMIAEDENVTFDELRDYKLDSRMELADRILDDLFAAVEEHGDDLAKEAAQVLKNWDRQANAESKGAALFAAWAFDMGFGMFAQKWDADRPRETPDGLKDEKIAAEKLSAAAEKIKNDYGAIDVAWGEVYRLRYAGKDLPANGASGALGVFRVVGYRQDKSDKKFAAGGGDSYVALIEFSDPVRAEVLTSYGNSTQPHSKHRGDQLELFSQKKFRKALRTRAEIEAHLEYKDVLNFAAPAAN